MNINLKGQHALVTGGSRGIGKAIVRRLAECGAKVAIHYNKSEDAAQNLAKEIGIKGELFQAELSQVMDVTQLFDAVLRKFKKIDLLVNNAGIALPSPIEENTLKWADLWIKTLDVNLNAVGLLCKLSIDHFRLNGGGRIINIASRAAFRGDTSDYLAYAASKGGIVALTRSLARAFGKDNIKAFLVAPGFVRTDMAGEFIEKYGESFATDDIALSRMTEPDDVAPMVAFLASGLADHATGGTFDINGASYVH